MHISDDDDHAPQSTDFRDQAERCRRLSRSVYDRATAEMLDQMAQQFERGAPDIKN